MKLSSISLITATLATIASGAIAAPAPRPFQRDVDIYSRATEEEHKRAAEHHAHAASASGKTVQLHDFLQKSDIAEIHHEAVHFNAYHHQGHTNGGSYPMETTILADHTLDLANQHNKAGRKIIVERIKQSTKAIEEKESKAVRPSPCYISLIEY